MFEDITRKMFKAAGTEIRSPDLFREIGSYLEQKCGIIMPCRGDSLAISPHRPKTAALAFDKVYRFPLDTDGPPPEVSFFCGTEPEISLAVALLIRNGVVEGLIKDLVVKPPASAQERAENEKVIYRIVCKDLREELGLEPTICYANQVSKDAEFRPGPQEVLASSLSNIKIVNEDRITWDQVLEFRRDDSARRKYRRLIRWIDGELLESDKARVEDLIAKRLEDYEWSLKKHGLRASLGTVSALIDPKFLASTTAATATAAAAGGALWATLAAASLTIGRAVVSFGTAAIDGAEYRRKHNYEVAYVSDLKRRMK